MTKTLSKEKSILVAEYSYYIGRNAEYEQALMRASLDKNEDALKDCIIKAKWAANAAMTAARCLGLSPDYIPSIIKERSQ